MIKLSVVTVVYNAVEDIEKTIISVANLKSSKVEHLIIDGGSSDGTQDVIKRYKEKLSVFISEKDTGIYDAMNKGIDRARGKWILFLNAGDILTKEFNLSQLDLGFLSSKEFIFFSYLIKGQDNVIMPKCTHKFGMPTSHQAMLISTEVLKREKYNSKLKVAADYELYLKRRRGNRDILFFDNKAIVEVMPGGYSHENLKLMRREYQKIIYEFFGIKEAILYFMWSRRFVFNIVKKVLPKFIFLRLKSMIDSV
jgi:glycosyltransferase involved in cell wall biosynthesis